MPRKPKPVFEGHCYLGYKDGIGTRAIRYVVSIDVTNQEIRYRTITGKNCGIERVIAVHSFSQWMDCEVPVPAELPKARIPIKKKHNPGGKTFYQTQHEDAMPTPEALARYKRELREILMHGGIAALGRVINDGKHNRLGKSVKTS
jgi:hypothetical protein